MAVYLLSIPGGYIADRYLGARDAVLIGGAIIALRPFHAGRADASTFYLGLALVALGSGLFKPNISAMVGGLYAAETSAATPASRSSTWASTSAAFLAPLVTGFLAQSDTFKGCLARGGSIPPTSWHWGFGAAGVGMTLGLSVTLAQRGRLSQVGGAPEGEAGRAPRLLVIVGTLGVMALTVLSRRAALPMAAVAASCCPSSPRSSGSHARRYRRQRMAAVFVFFIAAMMFWAIFEQAGMTIALFAISSRARASAAVSFPARGFSR